MENGFLYNRELAMLYNWIQNQPHLPKLETLPMKHFLIACDGDLENAKSLIEKQYEMRSYYKQIFIERDPSTPESKKYWDITDTILFPGLTPDGDKIFFMRLSDYDVSKYNFVDSVKMMIMFYDTLVSEPDAAGLPKEYICVCDMKGYSLTHCLKFHFNTLRVFTKFYQEGLSIKLKNIHVINCTDTINKIMTVLTPLLNYRVRNMIKLHQPNTETIFQYIPKEMFPSDYGGACKSIRELKDETWKEFQGKRDYLMDRQFWEIDETKRVVQKSEGWIGSFVKSIW